MAEGIEVSGLSDSDLEAQEQAKYEKAWDVKEYRDFSPGEGMVIPFIHRVGKPVLKDENGKPIPPPTMYDYGAGTGRAALYFKLGGFDMIPVDIAKNCLDDFVELVLGDRLMVANLWDLPEDMPRADYGFCTDVMEHIPPEKVDAVLENIRRTCKSIMFGICFHDDHFGEDMGEVLHLTVKPFRWWRDKLRTYGNLIDARDLIWNGLFYVEFE
jgi:SAM-dependent methyltransferase